MRPEIESAETVVVKVGTYVVTDSDGAFATERLGALVGQCAELVARGKSVILVSSGAVGLGRNALGITNDHETMTKQACAAVGQSLLMHHYQELFARHDRRIAQLLVTAADFADRQRYLTLRETFQGLLSFNVVPVVNENDSVSTAEIKEDARTHSFGDNDMLSALVASKLGADLLLILTNVDGVYDSNPADNPSASRLDVLDDFNRVRALGLDGQSPYGRGGIRTKIEASRLAAYGGVTTLIGSGFAADAILDCRGTLVPSRVPLSNRKRWIGLSSGYGGVVRINPGAADALIRGKASLLPSGVVEVVGAFDANEVVSIETDDGREIARGITPFSSDQVRKVQGCHSREIRERLGDTARDELIHRDDLVVFVEG